VVIRLDKGRNMGTFFLELPSGKTEGDAVSFPSLSVDHGIRGTPQPKIPDVKTTEPRLVQGLCRRGRHVLVDRETGHSATLTSSSLANLAT